MVGLGGGVGGRGRDGCAGLYWGIICAIDVKTNNQIERMHIEEAERRKGTRSHPPAFFVNPITACLLVVYCTSIGVATKLAQLPILTMTPLVDPLFAFFPLTGFNSCFFMAADCARVARNMPKTLTSRKRWNSLTEASAISAGAWTPIWGVFVRD